MGFLRAIIGRPVMTTMIIVVLLVMGMYSYNNLVTDLIPSINYPDRKSVV